MKYIRKIFFALFLSSLVYPQENADSIITHPTSLESLQKIEIMFNEFDLLRQFNFMDNRIILNNNPETAMLWTSYILSGNSSFEWRSVNEKPGHLTSVLYDKYLEDSKFNAVKYVLGAAQLSAVGYLAYRHVKKYGFLK